MKNISRWCCKNDNNPNCINHSDEEGCCNWTCQCGHESLVHFLSTKENGSCDDDTPTKPCGCKHFIFKSNDNCDIACQIQRKVYENEIQRTSKSRKNNLKKRI